jgi:hypothetical protein
MTDGLAADWTAPLPVYRPMPLAGEPLFQLDENQLIAGLTERGGEWRHLSQKMRHAMDQTVAAPARRAPWRRLVVEGTGEDMGSAGDLAVVDRRGGASKEVTGFRAAHFVIGNGTRSGDGAIERTERPLGDESLVVALVGDFSRQAPTRLQLRALTECIDYARSKTGLIPVVPGCVDRAPVAAAVLDRALNASLAGHPAELPPRI